MSELREKIKLLQDKKLPRCNWRDFIKSDEPLPEKDQKELTAYFEKFLPPAGKCPGCDEKFGGLAANLGIGVAIEWGMAHGEGFCNKCAYPYRGMHYNIGPIKSLRDTFLAYHPDQLEVVNK